MAQLPARPRKPEPLPGSPEALEAAAERERILAAHKAAQPTAIMPANTYQLATPRNQALSPLPDLPPSTRATKLALPDNSEVYIVEKVPKATGVKPHYDVPHDFGSLSNQPDWLNDNGGQTNTCRVCGVTERRDLIRADRKGMNYHYSDAYGVQITSMVPLSCPTFLGDPNGAIAEAKQRVRKHDVMLETVDARLDRLEADNLYLREQLEAKIQLDVTGLVAWLSQMSQLSVQAQLPTTAVQVAGLPYEVPTPIADLVQGVGVTINVRAEPEDDDGSDTQKGIS